MKGPQRCHTSATNQDPAARGSLTRLTTAIPDEPAEQKLDIWIGMVLTSQPEDPQLIDRSLITLYYICISLERNNFAVDMRSLGY